MASAARWLRALAWLASVWLVAGRAAADPRALSVWHAYRGAEERALLDVLQRFEREQSLRVETLQVPYDAYAAKLGAAVPHGHGPDLFIDSHERFGDYLERGLVTPVPEAAVEPGAFAAPVLGALRHDGRLYGLPLAQKCLALYVNVDRVGEPPATLEGIAALRGTLPPGVFPIVYEVENVYFHAAVLHAFGGSLLAGDGRFGFVGERAARSIGTVRSLLESGAVPEEAQGSLVTDLFASGRAATAISGPWLASDLGDRVHYRVVPLPRIERAGAPMRPFLTVEALALTPRGARSEDALRLMRFLAGAESAEIRARVGRQIVTRVEPVPAQRGDAFLEAFAEQATSALTMPASARMRATWEPARHALKKALSGEVDAESALAEAERRFEDAVRPPPPPASPAPALVLCGVSCLLGAFVLVRRARAGALGPALRRSLPAYAWIAHAALAVLLLVLGPIAVGALTSLFAGKPGSFHYVGLANFVEILTARGGPLLGGGSFWLVLLVTLAWTLANVALHVAIGVSLGLLLSRPALALRPLYRVLLIVPWAVPSYVTALAWKGMFSRQFGAVSALVDLCGVTPFSWWARFSTAFSANVATNVWLGFPFMMVVTLGALTAIPKDVLEAAEVDGATRAERLWRVTLPMVAPVLLPAVVLGAIWTFNMFNVVFLVSGGEPDGATDLLVSEAYRWAFTREAQYGYAAAYSVLIFGLLSLGSRTLGRLGMLGTREAA